jgi:hypothetical protein
MVPLIEFLFIGADFLVLPILQFFIPLPLHFQHLLEFSVLYLEIEVL